MDLKRWQRLKEQADDLSRRAERAAGARDGVLERLRAEHKVKSLEEGEKLLAKLERKTTKAEKEAEIALAAFEAEHGDKLNGYLRKS